IAGNGKGTGDAGAVGRRGGARRGLILPYLRERREVRVLDVRPPEADVDHVVGDATDPETVARAMEGVDAVPHCAMAQIRDDMASAAYAVTATHVHVASVHVTLQVAREAGARHAVVIGSMSVFRDLFRRTGLTENDGVVE
ncbi:MAG: NAD(P)H-binding protein, partial [Micromonosporaceae bacterium]